MEISEINKELINNFRQILSYGFTKLQAFPLHEDKYRLKKRLLYLMMAATQSYSEAILKLMGTIPVYDKAAEVLFRALAENNINLGYIYSKRTQENALIFLAFSIQDNNDFARRYRALMLKYPHWNLNFGNIDTPAKWDNFIDKNNRTLDIYQKKFKIKLPQKFPYIKERALEYDNYQKLKKTFRQDKSFESYYVHYYKFFSQVTHLTQPGLERFLIHKTDGGMHIVIDGDDESISRMLAITYQLYYIFLRFTLQEFDLYKKEEFVVFNKFSKSMIRDITSKI